MSFAQYLSFFRPAPHIARLAEPALHSKYQKLRWQVFIGIAIGYMGFYLVRHNFVFAIPYLLQEGFTKTQMGLVFSAFPLAYGISKFVMGAISDHSNPRYFMAIGLILSALINVIYGTGLVFGSLIGMLLLTFFNGWVQGMGWPALIRTIVHWFSRYERGTRMSIIAATQNVGIATIGPLTVFGVMIFKSWHSIFYFPAIIAIVIALLVILLVRDTPQSEGLPPIEEYCKQITKSPEYCLPTGDDEQELTVKEILGKYILVNKYLWYLAIINIFIYLVHYGVMNWAPTYLKEVKGFTPTSTGIAYFLHGCAGIPGTILCGWLSDRVFNGYRAPVCILYMLAVSIAIVLYWLVPAGNLLYDNLALLMVGFFIQGPLMLINVFALDLVPKKAAGTAVGLIGLFGSIGGATFANLGIGYVVDRFGWDAGCILLLVSCGLAILLLTMVWYGDTQRRKVALTVWIPRTAPRDD